jgi:hypothetical protein
MRPQLQEADIIEVLELMCDPDSKHGEWLLKMDMVEQGDTLRVVNTGQVIV